MIRKNIYKWHRTISLIIAIPVILWAASGFMHPVMTTIRPKVGTQELSPQTIDTTKIIVLLQDALLKNNIDKFSNFRIVQLADNWFYQIQLPGQNVLQYISTQNGKLLKNGDELYARFLAKQFLEGVKKTNRNISVPVISGLHDCCVNAATAVLNDTSGAKITEVELVEKFNEEYKYINRFLPAYKVSFERKDGIRIYVETQQDRFAFAMDNRRAVFDTFFSWFHTLGWLDFLGKGKLMIEIVLMSMAFLATLMGIYIFCITKTKTPNGNTVVAARRNHRWTSIVISLFTLMFTGSGAFHLFTKFSPDTRAQFFTQNVFTPVDALLDIKKIFAAAGAQKKITTISIVKINGKNYWQVFSQSEETNKKNNIPGAMDMMKRKVAPAPSAIYISTDDHTVLKDGEMKYANYLATLFSKHRPDEIVKTTVITKFEDEYGFVNKRLPVWRVHYNSNSKERFYVETSTGKLAAHVNDKDLIEGYSFAMLHKHHFMDWAGKSGRDISTMFWALAQIAVVVIGLTLYFKMRARKTRQQQ
ncbi:PepSY domain-containing protein [Ferruginibacter lapsinanis]|uniref:PepSY domain-containing protein n=1 Tax=Ferruginibacter lapsinanis TaxID=563172 RepID=UPI001E474702|nr:PepSY domain-containing protein [Ferruginibacter lapsinanis]UEG51034.1 PepSY domain-containing protein [Ferruginibacter lapsinanis]